MSPNIDPESYDVWIAMGPHPGPPDEDIFCCRCGEVLADGEEIICAECREEEAFLELNEDRGPQTLADVGMSQADFWMPGD